MVKLYFFDIFFYMAMMGIMYLGFNWLKLPTDLQMAMYAGIIIAAINGVQRRLVKMKE